MNFITVISEMEEKIEALRKDRVNYEDEKALLERRLKEVNDLLAPIATDIEGLEMAVESLRSTSFAQSDEVETVEEEPASDESPKKPRKNRSEPIHINKYDQYGMLMKRYGSIKEAKVGLRWGYKKVMDSLLMDKAVQLSRYGFYISRV